MVAAWIDSSAGFNEIRAQLFTPSKTWNGGEIVVDEPGLQATDLPPRVAISPDGSRFAVTWGQYLNDGAGTEVVRSAMYDGAGNLIEQFEAPWEDNGTQAFPDVAITPSDNALISYVATHADGSQTVQLDTLDPNGIYQGTQILQYISGPADGYLGQTHIATAPDGSYAVGYLVYGGGNSFWTAIDLQDFTGSGQLRFDRNYGVDSDDFALAVNPTNDGVDLARISGGYSYISVEQIDGQGNLQNPAGSVAAIWSRETRSRAGSDAFSVQESGIPENFQKSRGEPPKVAYNKRW